MPVAIQTTIIARPKQTNNFIDPQIRVPDFMESTVRNNVSSRLMREMQNERSNVPTVTKVPGTITRICSSNVPTTGGTVPIVAPVGDRAR